MDIAEAKKILEAVLLCAHEPLSLPSIRKIFTENDEEVEAIDSRDIKKIIDELTLEWATKGVELVSLSAGWRFQSRAEVKKYLDKLNPEKPPKYSRATLETLAIIVYRQPVTRGDIEEIRGVTVASQTIKILEDRNWIESIGYRDVAGRPTLFATTKTFLNDMGINSLGQLPVLHAVKNDIFPLESAAAAADDAQFISSQGAIDFSRPPKIIDSNVPIEATGSVTS